MKIKIPDKFMGKPVAGGIERRFAKGSNPNPTNPVIVPVTNPITNIDSWEIPHVMYNNQLHTVYLLKELLDNGNSHTQEDWSTYTKNNKFGVGDLPLYFALFNQLYNTKNNQTTEEIKQFINKQMLERWLMTLTRIEYNPQGNDKVIHNYNLTNPSEKQANIVGPDDYVIKLNEPNTLEALVGCNNIQKINEIFNWITGKNTYLWRVNNKPSEKDIRVARFVAGSDRASLSCYGYPLNTIGALGVYTCAEGA